MASPGVVVRRGKDRNYVTGHSRWTSGSRAGFRGGGMGPRAPGLPPVKSGPVRVGYSSCSISNGIVTNAVLIERAVSC